MNRRKLMTMHTVIINLAEDRDPSSQEGASRSSSGDEMKRNSLEGTVKCSGDLSQYSR